MAESTPAELVLTDPRYIKHMPALYLDMQGAVLHKEAGEFVVRFSGQAQHVPKAQVERIIILGNVQLTTQVIADVLQHQVPVFFLSSHGRFRGSLSAPSDGERCFACSKAMGKVCSIQCLNAG